jgi:prephenate dehydrogenase
LVVPHAKSIWLTVILIGNGAADESIEEAIAQENEAVEIIEIQSSEGSSDEIDVIN